MSEQQQININPETPITLQMPAGMVLPLIQALNSMAIGTGMAPIAMAIQQQFEPQALAAHEAAGKPNRKARRTAAAKKDVS